ncbi:MULTISPECIES: hypothetical protein [Labrys]|uniref:hypothetical protein n=1 Tax=Labrys TaxID=204476 RepID=UPI001AE0B53C|nr:MULTISPECIES: hypothetical protein [unclassified Labrys (in: a-proteobacteria)]MBP0581646.1 hypothetical protein [Labrys sp. LIt4]MDZ5450838.1 hypothetical protein [Labrys sp. ZIDIC5]
MFYRDGKQARLGDRVRIHETQGVVVLSIDTNEFTPEFKREDWSGFLEHGVMIRFEKWGLIHYIESDEDLEFVSRAEDPRSHNS